MSDLQLPSLYPYFLHLSPLRTAQAYINTLYARSSTNISAAFGTAVPQFSSANDSTANIIIFLTDGQPSDGIIDQTLWLATSIISSSILEPGYEFLNKVWAKRKIETLLIRYYGLPSNSTQAIALRSQIVSISVAYGVISPFTSFSGSTAVEEEPVPSSDKLPATFELLGNYPNPFNPTTTIRLRMLTNHHGSVEVRIYNTLGQLVRTLHLVVNGEGVYNVVWDGRSEDGKRLAAGVYLYAIDVQNTLLVGKMNLIK